MYLSQIHFQAAEIAFKFLTEPKAAATVENVAPKLIGIKKHISVSRGSISSNLVIDVNFNASCSLGQIHKAFMFFQAAEMYLKVDKIKEAVDAFIDGGEWSKAKKVAKELEPRYYLLCHVFLASIQIPR